MIKTIIFDFDGTMYVGNNGDVKAYEKQLIEGCFGKNVYSFLQEKYDVRKKEIKSIVELCKKEGLDFAKLAMAFEDNFFRHTGTGVKVLPNSFFKKLKEKCKIYIASMSGQKYLKYYLKFYGIDIQNFTDVFSMDLLKDSSKADMMKRIMEDEGNKPEEVLMIGDNFSSDIKPAQQLGMNALHFLGDFNQLYDYFTQNNILDCEEFKKM